MMQALYLEKDNQNAPPNLKLVSISKPAIKPGYLLVKIHASMINPSDIMNSKGGFPTTTFPRVPGRDFAGTVVDGPTDHIGEEVYATSGQELSFTQDGSHAEYCLVPENGVASKPRNLTFAQAASVGVSFTTAGITLTRARATKDDTVLVLGAEGAVGSAIVQLAKQMKCRAVLTASRHDSTNINVVKDAELLKAKELTAGEGPSLVIDTTGDTKLIQAAIKVLSVRGRLAYIAAPRQGITDLVFDMKELYRKEQGILGCNSLLYGIEEMATKMTDMQSMFEGGDLQAPSNEKLVKMSIDDGVDAYAKAASGGGKKYVIEFS